MGKIEVPIVKHDMITEGIYDLWIEHKGIVDKAKPGQFATLYCKDGSRLLPRPISICELDKEKGYMRLVYRVVGEGTKEFSKLKVGQKIDILGPLGNGFSIEDKKLSVLVGGGIGIPPMLELCKQLKGEKIVILGYRDVLFLNKDFEKYANIYIATEDGSIGTKGNVLDILKQLELEINELYACGPHGMLKAIQQYVRENNITAQFSLEERMACGIGACLGCVCDMVDGSKKRVCKDGPVFPALEVVL